MSGSSGLRSWSPSLAIASAIVAGSAIGYIRLLGQQGDWPGPDSRQSFVLALLVALTITTAVGAVTRSHCVRIAAAAAAAAGLLPLGVLSLFSIGLVVPVAGAVAGSAWIAAAAEAPAGTTLVPSAGGAIVAIAVLAVGFIVT